jgi:hypothetical protein
MKITLLISLCIALSATSLYVQAAAILVAGIAVFNLDKREWEV